MKKIILSLAVVTLMGCSADDLGDNSCDQAAADSTAAMNAFFENNSEENCKRVKEALEHQRDVCGSLPSTLAGTLAELSCND